MTFTCPVCGYERLPEPPERYLICPCCGVEFGNDDEDATREELRAAWVAGGARWWSPNTLAPLGWSADEQLRRAGFLHAPAPETVKSPG